MIKKIKKVYNTYFWALFIIENPFSCCEENGVPVICIGRCMPEQENKEAIQSKRIAEEHINQSIALRAKHEEDKEHFEADIKRMQEKLYEKDEENKFEDKQFD